MSVENRSCRKRRVICKVKESKLSQEEGRGGKEGLATRKGQNKLAHLCCLSATIHFITNFGQVSESLHRHYIKCYPIN